MTSRARTAAAAAVLLLAIAAVYLPVLGFGFLGLDDPRYVSANERVQRGLTADNVRFAFANTDVGFYCPVTTLSHMADCTLFGPNAGGHHLTSLLLHAASAVLLLLAFRRMTGALAPSLVVAALFALHPLHVEPVAWIAERKEVISGFFWCVTLLAYSWYAPAPARGRYLAVFAASTLAMLAKPMAVSIPFALLLLDVWPLGRWPATRAARLIGEKIPLLAPALLVGLLTVKAQAGIGAVGSAESFPLGERVANALFAYGAYVGKTLVPVGLAALYPFRHGSMPLAKPLLGCVVLLGGTTVALLAWKTRRYVTVGWFWFVGTLVPTIGLLHVGSQSMADRYTYIPLIGLFAIVAFGADAALAQAPAGARRAAAAFAVVAIAGLSVASRAQVLTWKDDESLNRQIIRVSPDAILAYFNLGNYELAARNDPRAAVELYQKALAIDPRHGDVHLRLGLALARLGKNDEAREHLREAVRLKPGLVEAHMNLGLVEGELRDWNAAAASLEKATQLAPGEARIWGLLGFAQLQKNDRTSATSSFQRAAALEPRLPQPHYYLSLMAREAGDEQTAKKELELLRSIDPGMAGSIEGSAGR